MIIIMILVVLFSLTTAVLLFMYLRQSENVRLDRMGLQNLINDQEKAYYISEYKKILVAQFIYETMAEEKSKIDVTREVIKGARNIPVIQYFPPSPGIPAQEVFKGNKTEEEK